MSVEKHPQAKYMGFGGQGGKGLFKDNTYMNYFSEVTAPLKMTGEPDNPYCRF